MGGDIVGEFWHLRGERSLVAYCVDELMRARGLPDQSLANEVPASAKRHVYGVQWWWL
jgi:hypothetical protein